MEEKKDKYFYSKILKTPEELESFYTEEILGKGYQGWLWLSGSPVPYVVFEAGKEKEQEKPYYDERPGFPSWEELTGGGNFIWEFKGWKNDGVSLSISFSGGCWMINRVDVKHVPAGSREVSGIFLTRKLGRTIKMSRYFIPSPDPLCAELETLQPAWTAFKGFGKKNDQMEVKNGGKNDGK